MAEAEIFDKIAHQNVTKVIAAIVLEDPFYGYMLLRREVLQNPNIPTASTNGIRIQYNPAFIRDLSLDQLKGLFKHEVMHIASMHHLRRGLREPGKWGKACDYVINALLIEQGVALPEGGLFDKQYVNYSAEHVYNMLPDEPGGNGDGGTQFGPKWDFGGVEDAPGSEHEDVRSQMEEDCKVDVLQAVNAAKMMGKLPANIERLVEGIRESKMPWRKILARFFRATGKDDYSWMRPNRRFLAHGIYLPSLYSETLGTVVIGIDTSGSICGPELEQFFGCINGILKQTKPEAVHVVYCDARVQNTQVFTKDQYPLSLAKFKPKGGGGTDFRPVFDYVAEKRLNPVCLLYLTDMYGSFPDKAPKYPVIWCATSETKGPFGKTLEIN